MYMKNDSEVFENYVKIIKSKKLDEDPYKPKSVGKAKDITKLYYQGDDFIEYEKSLMEIAHPNKAIITPTYDPVNALVENHIERQKIMLNIVRQPPTGQNTYKRYADSKNDLLLTLIKTANELDFQDSNLRVLADHCIENLKKKDNIIKKANPAVIGGIGVIGALIGLLYAQQHLAKSSQGLDVNYEKVSKELSDIIEKTSWGNGRGVEYAGLKGVEYLDSFIDTAKELQQKIDKVYSECSKVQKIIATLDKPRSASEAIEMSKQPEAKNIPIVFEMFKKIYDEYSPYFSAVVKKFSDKEYKLRQIKDKGLLDQIFDQVGLVGGKGLISDDFDDVRRSLQAFQESFDSYLNVLKQATEMKDKATVDLQSSVGQKAPEVKEEKPVDLPKPNQSKPKPRANMSKEDEEFIKQLNSFDKF